ncbi:MAG: OmpA family protein, partial [Bacillota bacterium]
EESAAEEELVEESAAEEELVEESAAEEEVVEEAAEEELVEESAAEEEVVAEAAEEEVVDEAAEEELVEESAAEEELVEESAAEEEVDDEAAEEVETSAATELRAVVKVSIPELNKLLGSIFFDFNKSAIRSADEEVLVNECKILAENPDLYISIGGHCDERGTRQYNMGLAARRADTIRRYLINQGINPDKIIVYAYGEDFPLKKGHNEAAWRFNRRVDIQLWEAPPSQEQCLKRE